MSDEYVYQPMMTYLGNKRKLISNINSIVKEISNKLGKEKLDIVDGFCGSTVVSRSFIKYANKLYTNDLELYSYLMSKCFLIRPRKEDILKIHKHIENMNNIKTFNENGLIYTNYAPKDMDNIKQDERCFYSTQNAKIIDTMNNYINNEVEDHLKHYCLVPLLIKCSIHTNTSGVFKGFYKNKEGIGCFGGTGKNALSRILKQIEVEVPIWHDNKVEVKASNLDIEQFCKDLPSTDVVYLDPPYNQHPYGSNYFMLNVIANNKINGDMSKVSGIPNTWNKSDFNYKQKAKISMMNVLESLKTKTKYVILSYNNEGIIADDDWEEIFKSYTYEKREFDYNTFKGSRNLDQRSKKVVEILYILCPKPI